MAGIFVRAVTTWATTPTAATSARTVTGSVTGPAFTRVGTRLAAPSTTSRSPAARRSPGPGSVSGAAARRGDSGAKGDVVGLEGQPRLEPYPGVVYRWRRTIVVILLVALFALVLVDVIAGLAG